MNGRMGRSREAAERFAERRRREDAAPRLKEVVPRLTGCRLELSERGGGSTGAEVAHIRRVVVDNAPALFFVPCGDSECRDGGHDLTVPLLRGLEGHRVEIRGEDTCSGYVGDTPCGRILAYAAFSEYSA